VWVGFERAKESWSGDRYRRLLNRAQPLRDRAAWGGRRRSTDRAEGRKGRKGREGQEELGAVCPGGGRAAPLPAADFTTVQRLDAPSSDVTATDPFFEFLFSRAPETYDVLKQKPQRRSRCHRSSGRREDHIHIDATTRWSARN